MEFALPAVWSCQFDDYVYFSFIEFIFEGKEAQPLHVHVFRADAVVAPAPPVESDEMKPQWFALDAIPYPGTHDLLFVFLFFLPTFFGAVASEIFISDHYTFHRTVWCFCWCLCHCTHVFQTRIFIPVFDLRKSVEAQHPLFFVLNKTDMWADDPHWLPRLLAGDRFRAQFWFRGHGEITKQVFS